MAARRPAALLTHKTLLVTLPAVVQVVLAWLLVLPRLPESCHQGLVGPPVHAQQVQGLHQGPVCLERHERVQRLQRA